MACFARDRTCADIRNQDFLAADVERFDVVFFSQVLEHVPTPLAFLEKVRSVARLVHLDVPNHNSLAANLRKFSASYCFGAIQPPHHLVGYDRRSLAHLLGRARLTPVILRSFRNDHTVWGQALTVTSPIWRAYYSLCHALDRASLLTAVCVVEPK